MCTIVDGDESGDVEQVLPVEADLARAEHRGVDDQVGRQASGRRGEARAAVQHGRGVAEELRGGAAVVGPPARHHVGQARAHGEVELRAGADVGRAQDLLRLRARVVAATSKQAAAKQATAASQRQGPIMQDAKTRSYMVRERQLNRSNLAAGPYTTLTIVPLPT